MPAGTFLEILASAASPKLEAASPKTSHPEVDAGLPTVSGMRQGLRAVPMPNAIMLGSGVAVQQNERMVVLIESRTIIRDCLAQAMRSWTYKVDALPSVEGCAELVLQFSCDLIILCESDHTKIAGELNTLRATCSFCPVLVICDTVCAETAIEAFELGARGILPTSSNLGILNSVIGLILSGGAYVPPDSMIATERAGLNAPVRPVASVLFTPREASIIAAIRKGSPNKVIAYNLNMRESTVKVHMRSIMKKLNVKNRTELALKKFELKLDY